jgi:outer membrane protein assembly factor BamB
MGIPDALKEQTGATKWSCNTVQDGDVLWTADLDAPDVGGAVVVNDLVFTSAYAGEVLAFTAVTS